MKKMLFFLMSFFIISVLFVATLMVSCRKGVKMAVREEPPIAETPGRPLIPFIWDDDGSPDGVIALLYLLRHPEVNVKAITVSCG